MSPLPRVLVLAARNARVLLVAGLAAGILLPGLAAAMKPWLPELVALLLFLAALRVGPRQALGAAREIRLLGGLALFYQLALPLGAIGLLALAGLLQAPLAVALVLMLSAPAIAGSPALTVMVGHDPAPALRMLVLGTLLLPLTVLPVFWLLPQLGAATEVLGAAARLLGVIAASVGAAFVLRAALLPAPSRDAVAALDGLSAIGMTVIVVGLMSAIGPALRSAPDQLALWLCAAVAANFGLQIITGLVLPRAGLGAASVPCAIIAGNRNIALFLVALPASVTDPILLFIGCYQVPMYLTPLALRGFYGRAPHLR